MPQPRTTDFEQLNQQMLDENRALKTLHETLLHEQSILADNLIDKLPVILEQKSTQLDAIASLVAARSRHMETMGYQNNAEDMQTLLGKSPSLSIRSELDELWQQNLELLDACHRQNQINGIIIEVGNHSTRFVLDLLQKTSNEPTVTYNKKGKTSQSGGNPPLAKA